MSPNPTGGETQFAIPSVRLGSKINMGRHKLMLTQQQHAIESFLLCQQNILYLLSEPGNWKRDLTQEK